MEIDGRDAAGLRSVILGSSMAAIVHRGERWRARHGRGDALANRPWGTFTVVLPPGPVHGLYMYRFRTERSSKQA